MNRGNLRAWANYRYPNQAAFIFGEKRLTFGEMLVHYKNRLTNGIGKNLMHDSPTSY